MGLATAACPTVGWMHTSPWSVSLFGDFLSSHSDDGDAVVVLTPLVKVGLTSFHESRSTCPWPEGDREQPKPSLPSSVCCGAAASGAGSKWKALGNQARD